MVAQTGVSEREGGPGKEFEQDLRKIEKGPVTAYRITGQLAGATAPAAASSLANPHSLAAHLATVSLLFGTILCNA